MDSLAFEPIKIGDGGRAAIIIGKLAHDLAAKAAPQYSATVFVKAH
jgi:hypothetical protein